MQRISTSTAVANLFGAGKSGFGDGDPLNGTAATALNAAFFNAMQEELAGIAEAFGLVLDPNNNGQVLAAIKGFIQQQSGNYAADTGAVNAYVVALSPVLVAHVPGMPIRAKIGHTNTGASTLDPGPGALPIVRRDGSALIGNELVAGDIVDFVHDGAGHYRYRHVAVASNATTAAGTDTQSAVTPAGLLSLFGRSLGQPGYQKLPGGLILQWGDFNCNTTGGAPLTFPIAFPVGCMSLVFMDGGITCYSYGFVGLNPGGTTIYARVPGSGALTTGSGSWTAIGY